MGRVKGVLEFNEKTSPSAMRKACNEWGAENCDPGERGGCRCSDIGNHIRFTEMLFDTRSEAVAYLKSNQDNYIPLAVRYKIPVGKEKAPTQKLLGARKKVQECQARINALEKPHYAGVTSKTVGCKNCGSALATAYCGKSYSNYCPVCKADLRPASALQGVTKAKAHYKSAVQELQQLEKEFAKKQVSRKCDIHWLIMCEEHC